MGNTQAEVDGLPEPTDSALQGVRSEATNSSGASYTPVNRPALEPMASVSNDITPNGLIFGPDGRLDIDVDSKLARTIGNIYPPPSRKSQQIIPSERPGTAPPPQYSGRFDPTRAWNTRLNIVIQVVGSRGDVQPFVALGTELQSYGHRVRIGTHNVFEKFVRDAGLEFYPIGGNPAELMSFMVKNPGLIPSMSTLMAGEIQRKRHMVREMLEGCWDSCVLPDTQTGDPFVADAIIANPPSFAHVHCAQALGIPVHLMFTMPWSSTEAFPHPLANLKNAGSDRNMTNYLSYGIVEFLTWQGLGDIINQWRSTLQLEEVALFDGPKLAEALKVPFTYCWSPALVPKPSDWPAHIDVVGFFFREVPHYEPPADLVDFLATGSLPVYIGFGSIVLENPEETMETIMQAIKKSGIRAIVSRGWSNLAGSSHENIYFIGDCPHEWLFQNVSAVVHHGGAGTTACGLRNGRPTTVVPFFGDQPFWGQMIAAAGAGPKPIPHKELSVTNLANAIRYCLSDEAIGAAASIARKMQSESGVQAAARSFHANLPAESLQCDLLPGFPAVWSYKKGRRRLKLSKLAAEVIRSENPKAFDNLVMYQSKPLFIETTRWDPISGGSSAVLATTVDLTSSITGIVTKPIDEYRYDLQRRGRNSQQSETRPMTASGSAYSGVSSVPSGGVKEPSLAGKMVGASAKSIGMFAPIAIKGMMVDIPLAITEGMRTLPAHQGVKVRDTGRVTGIASGAAMAGKTFAWGMIDGFGDLFIQPYKGARKEGALGAVKGIGKGVISFTAKNGAGVFGMFAYPSQGIAQSIRSAAYNKVRKQVGHERRIEGAWLVRADPAGQWTADEVLTKFRIVGGSK